jgi:OTU domain-containing protein 6
MPSSKRNKSKKSTSATPTDTLPPQSSLPDDELMDDLFAQLDSRDKQSPQDTPVNKVEERIDSDSDSRKQNSKVRHLARQVSETCNAIQDRVHLQHSCRHERRPH